MAENKYEREVMEIIQRHGGTLTRHRKHRIYAFPDGKKFTMPSTPSDVRASLNQLRDLRKVLGVDNQGSGPGERRVCANKPGRDTGNTMRITPSLSGTMAEKLALAGVSQRHFEEKIAAQAQVIESHENTIDMLRAQHAALESEYAALAAKRCECWWCRLKVFVKVI